MLTVKLNTPYLNGNKEVITLVGTLQPGTPDYDSLGHRFVDERGTGYTETGQFNKNNPVHPFNLVGEMPAGSNLVAKAAATGTVNEQPGFFEHLGNKMRDNPFKTTLGLTLAVGAGIGAYNYSNTGSLTGDAADAADVAVAAADFIGSWR